MIRLLSIALTSGVRISLAQDGSRAIGHMAHPTAPRTLSGLTARLTRCRGAAAGDGIGSIHGGRCRTTPTRCRDRPSHGTGRRISGCSCRQLPWDENRARSVRDGCEIPVGRQPGRRPLHRSRPEVQAHRDPRRLRAAATPSLPRMFDTWTPAVSAG